MNYPRISAAENFQENVSAQCPRVSFMVDMGALSNGEPSTDEDLYAWQAEHCGVIFAAEYAPQPCDQNDVAYISFSSVTHEKELPPICVENVRQVLDIIHTGQAHHAIKLPPDHPAMANLNRVYGRDITGKLARRGSARHRHSAAVTARNSVHACPVNTGYLFDEAPSSLRSLIVERLTDLYAEWDDERKTELVALLLILLALAELQRLAAEHVTAALTELIEMFIEPLALVLAALIDLQARERLNSASYWPPPPKLVERALASSIRRTAPPIPACRYGFAHAPIYAA